MSNSSNSNATCVQPHEMCKVFSFEGTTDVQVVIINGNPFFVAVDVCSALDLQNTTKALYVLDEDEKLPLPVVRSGQQRTVNVVNESGLYALIFQSRKPIAKKFRKWVTSEVLPAIRKTGMYATPQAAAELTGQHIQVTGADGNLYLFFILKAMREFIEEETKGRICHELRFVEKFKAACMLCPEDKKKMRNINVKVN